MRPIVETILAVAASIAVVVGLFTLMNLALNRTSYRWERRLRPWAFVGPALVFLTIGLVIPAGRTIYLSFREGRRGNGGYTLSNYTTLLRDNTVVNFSHAGNILTSRLFILGAAFAIVALVAAWRSARRGMGIGDARLNLSNPLASVLLVFGVIFGLFAVLSTLRGILWNNLWWVAAVTGLATVIGLALAVLADRSRSEAAAKTLIFMPMAISLVGAAVIWSFVYNLPIAGQSPGVLNAVIQLFGMKPIDFVRGGNIIPWNSFFIMIIMIWIQTGFAMVVFSAAIKSVPAELIEAAKVDGASEVQIFWRITLPQILSTVMVVVTTLIVTVMKVFDLVKATTNGNFDTDVLANRMYENLRNGNFTLSSTFAVMILVLVVPVMWFNFRRVRRDVVR
ncbi:MAG TPA: sugar ABC transporter permease [Acidimicrobiales bacterium]|jgi:alpha-glucoside transport system permease protein|nr:sugar ABC transporter permease [Acidimicrobiales bacterium]